MEVRPRPVSERSAMNNMITKTLKKNPLAVSLAEDIRFAAGLRQGGPAWCNALGVPVDKLVEIGAEWTWAEAQVLRLESYARHWIEHGCPPEPGALPSSDPSRASDRNAPPAFAPGARQA